MMIMARIVNIAVRIIMLINMSRNIGIKTIKARKPKTDIDTPKQLNKNYSQILVKVVIISF